MIGLRHLEHEIRNATVILHQLLKGLPTDVSRMLARADVHRIEKALTDFERRNHHMISPTGGRPRLTDNYGSGVWGASRKNRKHMGTDYICVPSQQVFAPIAGTIVREAKPYSDSDYSGCLIEGARMVVKIFYISVAEHLIGKNVEQGQVIGYAQDITLKYPGITPHVHLQIDSIDPAIFTELV